MRLLACIKNGCIFAAINTKKISRMTPHNFNNGLIINIISILLLLQRSRM